MTISCKQEEWLIVKKSKSWTRNGYSALFCQTANLIRTISHFTGDKLGNIIRFHQAGIVVRLLLREQKRFTGFAILPDIRNERTRVQSIQTPAAEHNPSSVGRPRMVTFRIIAVERFRIGTDSGLQVDHIQVGILMPDRESCIIRFGEKQILVIWWDTGEWSAFIVCRIDRVDCLSERTVVWVKGDTANRVFNLFQPLGQLSGRSRFSVQSGSREDSAHLKR